MAEAKYDDDPELFEEKNEDPDFGTPPWEEEKKSDYWMGGVFHCFSNVVSMFKGEEYKSLKENVEVPIEKITDLFYLGSGAQGVVFGAHLDGEKVAVKQLRTKHETNIRHLLKLNHENIVRFLGVCTNPPDFCIIMEYCQYGSLFDFLHSNTVFMPKQILKWAKEIARGMAYLHAHKIIHRDLKSPNILISDELMVKVSDFGTSREWNDVSAVMSFTGTVAWMAPEVIRHEPCSERVDVWSFGVVMWELLTVEVPYKNLETHAIMWGVGTNSIALPIPSNCPSSLQQLLKQCWNRVPRNRPPFKIIAAHLEMAGGDLRNMDTETFKNLQNGWRAEVHQCMERLYARNTNTFTQENTDVVAQRREDLKQARDLRYVYEQQVSRANELFLEVCAVRLQLEQRERTIAEKENALNECRCGHRAKLFQRQTSSSSDGMKIPILEQQRRRKKKIEPVIPAQVVVQYDEKNSDTTTVVDHAACPCTEQARYYQNNNQIKKETVIEIEDNGNVFVNSANNDFLNDNYIPDVAQV
ncbi:mitogen-activated protein kinase kinase kinase 12-like [Pieris napi]|uniref:mitogen-activated protein kinase kinase kinase 12-like n=1 Tax=Pieris napi TaxID=78633 RepID=UPI001FB974DC|nr:mitogen-activated protein kinase kinase kinase 12-like [Pieris napi]